MKKMLLFLAVLLVCKSTIAQKFNENQDFYSLVLSDFGMHTFYVSLDIRSQTYSGRVVVPNDHLYDVLQNKNNYSEKRYISILEPILKNHSILDLGEIDLNYYGFLVVRKNEKVSEDKQYFFSRYFNMTNGVYVIKDSANKMKASIVNKLFEWKIPCKTDDESGYLYVLKEWIH
ncbi:MAG: hypothetical protein JST70_06265 [Bacteroidetes bacterium]|nr:hypothetical protein [Bacteroidota bacterium]